MRRFTVPFLVVAVLLVSVAAVSVRPSVVAREATPSGMSMANHPLVGAWRWNNAPEDPIPYTYAIFHDDGTYIEVTMGVGTIVGVWQPTGARTADLTALSQDIDPSMTFEAGTGKVLAEITVDESGTTATAPYTVEIRTPDGALVDRGGPFDGSLTRLKIEPMEAMETPMAGTPTP